MQKKRTFKAAFTCRWAPSDGENGKDGVGIKSADVVFATSTSGTSAPADSAGWVTLFKDLQLKENTYVWSCTKTVLTDGTTTYTGKQCLGASKDFVTITEQYAVGSSGTTPPTSGWGTNYTPTKELWLWTRNRMQWTNGSYTYTTAICIGYFGKDGENGENGETSFNVSISTTAIVAHQSAEKQIFEITLQATRGSVLLKYYTDYTCSTLSDTNKITDGLVWGFDVVTGNSSFKYKLALLANAIVNVDIPFYVTDNRTSMKYPFKISFTTVKDGDKGEDGVPGLIQRVSEWTAGAEYHNDEKLTTNIRYLDIVSVTDNTTGDFTMYQCRETHTSTASNAPKSTDTAQWLKLNNMRPIYTPLIVAKNAVLRFGQTNRLLIMDTEGKKVQGCLTGVDDPTKPMAWFGGETASAANFSLGYDGTIKALRGIFGGVMKKSKTVVTPENFLYYFQRVNDGLTYYNMKWDRLSMFFELKGDFSKFMDDGGGAISIVFPGIRPEASYSIEEIEEARSFVGASVCICNSSSTNFGITGDTGHLYDGKFVFNSPPLFSGDIIYLTCVAASGDNAVETIGWTFVDCNQTTASK